MGITLGANYSEWSEFWLGNKLTGLGGTRSNVTQKYIAFWSKKCELAKSDELCVDPIRTRSDACASLVQNLIYARELLIYCEGPSKHWGGSYNNEPVRVNH